MAGLLDFLGTDDAKLGLGLLAAGGQSATPLDTWQRVQGAVQGLDADKQRKLQLEYLQSQVAENSGQTALRQQQLALAKRKFDMQAGLLGYGAPPDAGYSPPAAPGGAGPGLTATPGTSDGTGGAVPAGASVPTPRGPMTLQQISSAYNIPFAALSMDLVSNDGKGIAEMVFKRGTPDMQVSNGYAYDKNKMGAGFLPQLNTAQNGMTSMVLPGAGGLPVVSAPPGALSTYNAYTDAGNRSAAAYKEGTPTIDANGRKTIGSVLSNVSPTASGAPAGYATEAQMRTTAAGDMGADPKAIAREISQVKNDLMKPLDEGSKKLLRDQLVNLQRQQANLSPAPMVAAAPAAGNVVDFSPEEKATQEAAAAAAKTSAVKLAEGKATNTLEAPQKVQQAGDAIVLIDKALAHPGLSTAVGLSGKIDPRNYVAGTDAQDFQRIREQLSGTAFLTAYQTLRGSGSISEAEGKEAKASVARLSTAQSEPAFREALREYRAILDRGYKNAAVQAKGETPSVGQEKPSRTVVKSGMYQGRKVIQYSDGSVDYAN